MNNYNGISVLYFGPISSKGEPSLGGYAAANRKNVDKLLKNGIRVIEIPKTTIAKLIVQPFLVFKYRKSKNLVVHIATPLSGPFMFPVILTLLLCKALNKPSVLDIRAGLFIIRYKDYGLFYKWLTRCLLYLAYSITVESVSYIEQIRSIIHLKKNIIYFPNTIDCDKCFYQQRKESEFNLFYFGRITLDKGVDTMFNIIHYLGENYHLYLAGPIAEDINKSFICNKRIKYLGVLNQNELREVMKRMHFFLFPTKHKGEGQSNSLIEAMAMGLVPITSNQGFCAEVVSDCGFVLPNDASYEDYIKAIMSLNADDIETYGRKCVEHIRHNHNIDIEIQNLILLYKNDLLSFS